MVFSYPEKLAICDSTKLCTGCHQEKQTSLFHLKGRDKTGQPRHQSMCKDCANISRTARYRKNKTRVTANKRSDLGGYAIDILFQHNHVSEPDVMEVMRDFIEAVYASRKQNSSRAAL